MGTNQKAPEGALVRSAERVCGRGENHRAQVAIGEELRYDLSLER